MNVQQDESQRGDAVNSSLARILVVDDEELIRDLLKMVLTDEGYTVVTAADGEEAIQRLEGVRRVAAGASRGPARRRRDRPGRGAKPGLQADTWYRPLTLANLAATHNLTPPLSERLRTR